MRLHTRAVRTAQEKLTLGQKSLAAPGTRTRVSIASGTLPTELSLPLTCHAVWPNFFHGAWPNFCRGAWPDFFSHGAWPNFFHGVWPNFFFHGAWPNFLSHGAWPNFFYHGAWPNFFHGVWPNFFFHGAWPNFFSHGVWPNFFFHGAWPNRRTNRSNKGFSSQWLRDTENLALFLRSFCLMSADAKERIRDKGYS